LSKSQKKDLDWFQLAKYTSIANEMSDKALCLYLMNRWQLYMKLKPFHDENTDYYESSFFPCFTEEHDPNIYLDSIKAEDDAFQRIKHFSIEDYTEMASIYDQQFDDVYTPDWMKADGYYCGAVTPTSVIEVVKNAEFIKGRSKFDEVGNLYKDIIKCMKITKSLKNERMLLPNELSYSYDKYLIDQNSCHTQRSHLSVDLDASDKQILDEISKILPLMRGLISKSNGDNLPAGEAMHSILGPLNNERKTQKPRETRSIDLIKVRDYRMPAIIDLYLWAIVEQKNLSGSDYLDLVFPNVERVSQSKVNQTYLPYIHTCLDICLVKQLLTKVTWEKRNNLTS
jgi:hypothetical protein